MAIATNINDSGTWRKAKKIFINDGGTWLPIKKAWVNDVGTWRQVFSGNELDGILVSYNTGADAGFGYGGGYGSMTPEYISSGPLVYVLADLYYAGATLILAGFPSPPTQTSVFSSITVGATTFYSASASGFNPTWAYDSGSGTYTSIWVWPSVFGFGSFPAGTSFSVVMTPP